MLFDLYDLTLYSLPVPVYFVNLEAPAPSHNDLPAVRLDVAFQTDLLASLVVPCIDHGDRFDAVHDVFVMLLLND